MLGFHRPHTQKAESPWGSIWSPIGAPTTHLHSLLGLLQPWHVFLVLEKVPVGAHSALCAACTHMSLSL